MTEESSNRREGVFWCFLVVWLGIQCWMVDAHWVNNDEGAHLMDSWLVTLGLIPEVDFDSREPLYVMLYLPVIWLDGGYRLARFVPVLCTFASALVLRDLCRTFEPSGRMGVLASLLFLYSPTVLMNTAVVKTEPPAILLSCLSIWAYSRFQTSQKLRWLFCSGVVAGAGYYIRESALAIFVTVLILLIYQERQPKGILVFLAGWSSVVGLVMGIYSRWMSWSSMVASAEIFPLSAVFQAVGKILNWGSRSSGGARASDQPWMETTRQFVEPVLMNQGILVAALLFVMASLGRSNASPWKRRCSYVAVLWLGITTLLYGYHTVNHGYYQYYFRELLPPVCLLAAAGLMSWGKSQRSLLQGLAVLLVAAVLFGFVFSAPSLTVAVIASAVTSVGLSALFWFKGWPLRSGLLLGTFLAGSLYAGAQTGLSYNCPFPPSTVRQVSRFLSDHTETDDEILSGAVIWEFQARRRPLGNWAHPLSLLIRGHGQDQWEQSFTQDPPAAMVLDKTMQKIFFPRFSQVEETLKKDYYRAATYGQVEIFLRKDRELSK